MKHTERRGIAAIANALASLHNRTNRNLRARRIVSRVGLVVSRRFRPAVLLLLLASLFISSAPSAPNSFARVSSDSRITASLATANRLAANLYQSLYDSYASSVNSLPSLKWKAPAANSNAFIPTPTLLLGTPTNLTVSSASNTSISLSWTSPSGSVDHYQVERSQSPQGPFTVIANPVPTNHSDSTVSSGSAYLYRVRAVDNFGAPSSPSTMAVGTAISFEDPTLVTGTTTIKKQHIYDLRQSVNAVRALAGLGAFTWTNSDLTGLQAQALHVQQLRDKLDEALAALSVPLTAYQDPSLATGVNGTLIKKIHIEQLRLRSTGGSSSSTGSVSSSGDSAVARLDPSNETGGEGENPLSRNFNWSIPLVGLAGRSGLDLGLSLSYNSLVWTRNGSTISFDDDGGFPSPGFRLGFPVIQSRYFNSQVGKYAFMLITPNGDRVELRQIGASNIYEAEDSSYLTMTLNADSTLTVRTTDGTQLSYDWKVSDYQCTKIKDRNGNFIGINYVPGSGRIDTVVDTLSRTIKFNYDSGGYLISITQIWNQGTANEQTHNWASFSYNPALPIQINFPGLTTTGQQNNTPRKVLNSVNLNNNSSRFDFAYTSWGQVWKISNYAADGHVLNYRAYNLPGDQSPQTDCPRFTERRDWAENWNRGGANGSSGLPTGPEQEVLTASLIVPTSASWTLPDGTPQIGTLAQVTAASGTYSKIYFEGAAGTSTGWKRGLPALVETYDNGNVRQRQSVTLWTQDNTAVPYPLNPRVTETSVYDPAGNRARTTIAYETITVGDGTSCKLPSDVVEFQADTTTPLRRSHTAYNSTSPYTSRRIIGLVSEKTLYEVDANTAVETLMSKVGFGYDVDPIDGTNDPVQHDNTNYPASFLAGRANLSSVKRYNVSNVSQFTTSTMFYNRAGSMVKMIDPANHQTLFSYLDQFSANGTTLDAARPATFAYPTTVTDPDNYTSTIRYHYDFGAATWKQTPQPNISTNLPGPQQTFTYDSIGRLQKATNLTNGSYTRYVYPGSQSGSQNRVDTYATVIDGASEQMGNEAHSFSIADGYGRVIASASSHPDITVPTPPAPERFSGQLVLYDNVGRAIKTSNPTETYASGTPSQWVASGDDVSAGWLYTQQTYDWKGRPLVTTNTDGSTKEASYSGCGCAGGQVVTLTDEGTLDGGVPKRRQQKIYSDVLGRTVKTEVLNWDGAGAFGTGGSVYSTTVNTYNARDQVTLVRQFQGAAPTNPNDFSCPSGTCQQMTMTYDDYGRLQTKHAPEQQIDPNNSASTDHTTWAYNADDTIQKVTDARGASSTLSYNNRHLVTGITYSAPSGITPTAPVSFAYDAVGNRTSMTDGFGSKSYSYDQLSQMLSETRTFTGIGTYSISYAAYNLAGEVTSITDPFNAQVGYNFDAAGRLTDVMGSGFANVPSYVSNIKHRAWGALKSASYGNNTSSTIAYNARLLPTEFRLTGNGNNLMRENYSYYNDGRLQRITDLDDTNTGNPATSRSLSRSYFYDHKARFRSGGGLPFGQTYQYDAFDNMTSRAGRYYYLPPASDAGSYTANRRNGWSYDADGRVSSSSSNGRSFSYDAAGRLVNTVETAASSTTNYSASFDGDGRLVYESQVTTSPSSSDASYIVRSTVLGGEVVTRLDRYGNKLATDVFADGLLFAKQTINGGPNVVWTQRNPLGVTETGNAVYDPLGNYVPFMPDTYQPPPPPYGANYPAGIGVSIVSPFSLNGCLSDGMPVNCDTAMRALEHGSAVPCPNNDCGPRMINGALTPFNSSMVDFQSYGLGIFSMSYNWGEDLGFLGQVRDKETGEMIDRIGTGSNSRPSLLFLPSAVPGSQPGAVIPPQNPGQVFPPIDLDKLKGLIQDRLNYGDCAEYVASLINKAAELSGGTNPAVSTNILGLFEKIRSQPNGGIVFAPPHPSVAGGGGTTEGYYRDGSVKIRITPLGYYADNPRGANLIPERYGLNGLHEVIHGSGQNEKYTEPDLLRAARALEPKAGYYDWNQALKKHCLAPNQR